METKTLLDLAVEIKNLHLLIKKQDEYIKFLGKELEDNAVFLHMHGMECPREVYEQGVEYRKEIEELRAKLDELERRVK